MSAANPHRTTVAAVNPFGWVVTIGDRRHLVAIGEVNSIWGTHRDILVDGTSFTATGGLFRRMKAAAIPLPDAEASISVRVHKATFARNFARNFWRTFMWPGSNNSLAWLVYDLSVNGVRDGAWVETLSEGRLDHVAFGRATEGLPCCGTPPREHGEWCPSQVPSAPHQDPILEVSLPASVAGQRLARWSVRGWDFFTLGRRIEASAAEALEAELTGKGLTIGSASQAFAGRTGPAEPPYAVRAIRFAGSSAADLPLDLGTGDERASTGWTTMEIAGRVVRRGAPEMIDQDEHLRGTPYAYDHGDVRFLVISDRDDWVADAVGQLPTGDAVPAGEPLQPDQGRPIDSWAREEGPRRPAPPGHRRRMAALVLASAAFVAIDILVASGVAAELTGLLIVGLGGGMMARAWSEIVAVTAGGMVGVLFYDAIAYGSSGGPGSEDEMLAGFLGVGLILVVVAGAAYWVRRLVSHGHATA